MLQNAAKICLRSLSFHEIQMTMLFYIFKFVIAEELIPLLVHVCLICREMLLVHLFRSQILWN